MSSKRIPLTRTSLPEQRGKQESDFQSGVDAGHGLRETTQGSQSHARDNRGDSRAERYHQASVHDLPVRDENAEAVLDLLSHYQGLPAAFGGAHGGG